MHERPFRAAKAHLRQPMIICMYVQVGRRIHDMHCNGGHQARHHKTRGCKNAARCDHPSVHPSIPSLAACMERQQLSHQTAKAPTAAHAHIREKDGAKSELWTDERLGKTYHPAWFACLWTHTPPSMASVRQPALQRPSHTPPPSHAEPPMDPQSSSLTPAADQQTARGCPPSRPPC